jgi:DNA-binding Lrp family transcriptional regulator
MSYRLDEIDKRILYYLAQDARNTSAPMVAEEMNVSPATIRNRINQLEEHGIIVGYHANIDYERADGRLTTVYLCSTPVPDRDRLAAQVRKISGVINVRQLMAGHGNVQVTAVGENMRDLSGTAREIANLGIEIENEHLIQEEYNGPYEPFGPEDGQTGQSIADVMPLSGDAEVITLTVPNDAPIAGETLQKANQDGLIDEDVLIVSIERDESVITPRGNTQITPDDLVTIFSREGIPSTVQEAFSAV